MPVDEMMKRIWKAWTARKPANVDKRMIPYMGRAVLYVQYMPAKPIKHGIKVFYLCCAFSAVLLSFEVCVGREDDRDILALNMCDRLCKDTGLTTTRGQVLYMDNNYIFKKLAKHIFNKYGWMVLGTIVPTEKKSRVYEDILFLKPSNTLL